MITDAQAKFSDAQAVTTGTQVSTNAYDMGIARDIGRGRELRIFANVVTAFLSGTSLQVNVIGSANSDLSSPTVLVTGAVTAEAALTAGKNLLDVVLPQTTQRYLSLHTAGAVSGGIAINTDSNTAFPAVTGC